MELSAAIDIAIGLCFSYFLLALFCSWTNEAIAAKLNRRGKYLFDGLRELLQDKEVLAKFVEHPLVESLDKVRGAPAATAKVRDAMKNDPEHAERRSMFPSYIPGSTVATVLLDVVAPPGGASRFADVRNAIDKIDDKKLRKGLLAIADRADHDVEALRKGIEDWYANTMDRVSGWYKSRTQYWLIAFGFVFALALNVDTFRIVRDLWDNPEMRVAVVKAAESAAKDEEVKKLMKAATEAGAGSAEKKAALDKLAERVDLHRRLGTGFGEAKESMLPVGWTSTSFTAFRNGLPLCIGSDGLLGSAQFWLTFIGVIVTACAVALGAPFWFELMNKLIDLRGAGKKPEK